MHHAFMFYPSPKRAQASERAHASIQTQTQTQTLSHRHRQTQTHTHTLAVLRTTNGKVTGFNVVMKVADIYHSTNPPLGVGSRMGRADKSASMLGHKSVSAMREGQALGQEGGGLAEDPSENRITGAEHPGGLGIGNGGNGGTDEGAGETADGKPGAGMPLVIESWGLLDAEEKSLEDKIEGRGMRGIKYLPMSVDVFPCM